MWASLFDVWKFSLNQVMLDALASMDFSFSYTFIAALIETVPQMKHKIMFQLWGCLSGGKKAERILYAKQGTKQSDVVKMNTYARKYLAFSPENPTGRYTLDLSSFCDFAVAGMVMKIDRWEIALADAWREKHSVNTGPRGYQSQ